MTNEKVVAVVEARMGSTRLPGKSLRLVGGLPLAHQVLDRVRRAKTLGQVVLATSTLDRDNPLADLATAVGMGVHRGSETDVLARILGASRAAGATVHVQCWGDCPFVDPDEIDRVVRHLVTSGADLVGNAIGPNRRLPYGLDVIALRLEALVRAEAETRSDPYHREHGTTYIYQTPKLFRIEGLATPEDIAYPDLNLTINEQSDYEFVCQIYDRIAPKPPLFGIRDVISLIRRSPDLLAVERCACLRLAVS